MKTEIVIHDSAKISQAHARHWGDDIKRVTLSGAALEISVVPDSGPGGFSIRINEAGNLIVTNYEGGFQTYFSQQLHLENTRPWNKPKKETKP